MQTAQVWEGAETSSPGPAHPGHILRPGQLSHAHVGPCPHLLALCPELLTSGEPVALPFCPLRTRPRFHLPRTPSPGTPHPHSASAHHHRPQRHSKLE